MERDLSFGEVKAPISFLATFSKWMAAPREMRLTDDSMSFICMAWESSSLSTMQARLLIW